MKKHIVAVHPDFEMLNKWYMNLGLSRWTLPIWRFAMVFLEKKCEPIEGVSFEDFTQGNIDMRIFTPNEIKHPAAAVWIHGGGMVAGSARTPQDYGRCGDMAQQLGIRVFSLNYRLAPENPFPAPLDDCHDAWQWILDQAEQYGIDTARIAVGGESGGGNIAAALVQRIHGEGGVQPVAQYLVYPCLDDRTGLDESHYQKKYASLSAKDVRFAWESYLGADFGKDQQPDYAVPGKTKDLSGLPPAWIGVGDADILYNDSIDYARRLEEAGVPVELEEVEGGPHGFETVVPNSAVSKSFGEQQHEYLRKHLNLS